MLICLSCKYAITGGFNIYCMKKGTKIKDYNLKECKFKEDNFNKK